MVKVVVFGNCAANCAATPARAAMVLGFAASPGRPANRRTSEVGLGRLRVPCGRRPGRRRRRWARRGSSAAAARSRTCRGRAPDRQQRLVLCGQQHVADAALHEGVGRAARPGSGPLRKIRVTRSFAFASLPPGWRSAQPEVVPARSPLVFGLGVITCTRAAEVAPSRGCSGCPLRTRNTIVGCTALLRAAAAASRRGSGRRPDAARVDVVGERQRHRRRPRSITARACCRAAGTVHGHALPVFCLHSRAKAA